MTPKEQYAALNESYKTMSREEFEVNHAWDYTLPPLCPECDGHGYTLADVSCWRCEGKGVIRP